MAKFFNDIHIKNSINKPSLTAMLNGQAPGPGWPLAGPVPLGNSRAGLGPANRLQPASHLLRLLPLLNDSFGSTTADSLPEQIDRLEQILLKNSVGQNTSRKY